MGPGQSCQKDFRQRRAFLHLSTEAKGFLQTYENIMNYLSTCFDFVAFGLL
jgi:hypothetical protein